MVIYVDFRCFQDHNFQGRGIGYHLAALLRTRKNSAFSSCKLVGLVDRNMSPVPDAFCALADEIAPSANRIIGSPCIYIDGSPMTHDTRFGLRFQNDPSVLNAAVLYDFIPMDWPGYLPTPASRIEYMAKLARLKKFDIFLPISEYTATRLLELLPVPAESVRVTGACVRRSLYEISARLTDRPSPYRQGEPYFVTFGGDDRRKNTDIAVKAVRKLNLIHGRRIPLKVIGFYNRCYKAELLDAAGHRNGGGFLEFYPNTLEEQVFVGEGQWRRPSVTDEELVSLHAGAIAAIAPSHIEGFSLPVVEAAVSGCPVIASSCAAHMELIDQPEALFHSDDVDALCQRLEALLNDPELRDAMLAVQADLSPKYHEASVGARFWQAMEDVLERRMSARQVNAARGVNRDPRIAFLGPYPPDECDAALYTKFAVSTSNDYFRAEVFTDAQRPLEVADTSRDAGKISSAPLVDSRIKAVVCVVADSPEQRRAFEIFDRYGGPCILHDFRLARMYLSIWGEQRFLDFAASALGRGVGIDEVRTWLDERSTPPLLLDRIVDRASPLIVNSPQQAMLLKQRYGVDAQVTTSCPTIHFDYQELTQEARQSVRSKYGIASDTFIVATFGKVKRAAGRDSAILAVDLLRSWNIPAELYFIGDVTESVEEIARVANLYNISAHVKSGGVFETDEANRDFLICADAGLQLRTYAYGQVSVPVANCIAAGLPCVTTADAASSCESPFYVRIVPDCFSPLHVAEELAPFWEAALERASLMEPRAAWLQTHNFGYYVSRLAQILESA